MSAEEATPRQELGGQLARLANLALGTWLVVSDFVWHHSPAEQTNTWFVGLLCFAFAVVALSSPRARLLNRTLAVWLFLSAFVIPSATALTPLNNAAVAIAMFAASLVPSGAPTGAQTPPFSSA